MDDATLRKRIWGWSFFDWAQQPYATLGLTFIFAPYFAAVASDLFQAQGATEAAANASAQSLWSSAQTVSGLVIAFSAPFLGAWADATGRRLPWIWVLSILTAVCAWSMWFVMPDGTGLMFGLLMFWIGFTASESAFNLNNAALPSLGPLNRIGRISGNATAFGYWGGVIALFMMLLFFAENESGTTLIGLEPILGLDPDLREGTRSVGPFIAIWFAVFMIPFFLWNREAPRPTDTRPSTRLVMAELWATVRGLKDRRSLAAFLLGSMFYRDALTAMYSYGGIYATLVLEWEIIQIGVFGIVAAIAAAVLSWVGGIADERVGPKPVIIACCCALIGVSAVIIGMSRESLFGIPLAEGSALPDVIFYLCGAIIGGAGGALYSASRSMMTRHTDPDRPAEAFGLFALTGKATAFLAPALITIFTTATQSNQLGFLPVIFLFLLGLFLLRWVQPKGDRAA
jgi:UMF1 family MFS transporter